MSKDKPLRVGLAGIGFMGWIHYLAYQRTSAANVTSFCSRNEAKRSGDWRGIQGNFGPPGEKIDVSETNVYETLDQMLEDPDVDIIDVCLPPHLHPEAVQKSLAAGKRVLCEKPLALTADLADQMAQAAGTGQLMVAHILPYMPEFRILVDACNDNRWGRPIAGRFKRTIGPPDWIPDFYDRQTVGGPLVDLHVHDAHLIRLLFGMPTGATSVCRTNEGTAKFYESIFQFQDPELVVSCGGGVIDSPARPFTHGYEVSFERATVQFESAAYSDGQSAVIPLVVMREDGELERPDLGDGDPIDGFVAEIEAMATSIRTGVVDPILDGRTAADALRICELQTPQ
ncbi:MAG: Gfo/Idh/MocA family oxidoreductase [Planctomycetota bacterium]